MNHIYMQFFGATVSCACTVILAYPEEIANSSIFKMLDKNRDKKLTIRELYNFAEDSGLDLDMIDTNQDEYIDNSEFVIGILQAESVVDPRN